MEAKHSLLKLFGAPDDDRALRGALRRFVATEGAAIRVLEAHADEPICLVKLFERFGPIQPAEPDLGIPFTGSVLRRAVLLQGAISGENFAYANSVLTPRGLTADVLDALVRSDQAGGTVLAQHRVETFRELVKVGFERAGPCATYFDVDESALLLVRQCLVHAHGEPVMRSTEKLPIGCL